MLKTTTTRMFAVGALLCATAIGMRSVTAPQPIRAATVDLEEAYEQLNELADARIRLTNEGETFSAENEAKQQELRTLQEELNVYAVGSAKYDEAEANLIQKTIQYDAWLRFQEQRLDRERSLLFEKAYNDIKKTLAEIAQSEGYDLIILNDSLKPLMRGTSAQTQQQISARRILYAADALDITADLVQKMNNAYANRQ